MQVISRPLLFNELKRLAGDEVHEEDFKKIMKVATKRSQGHAFSEYDYRNNREDAYSEYMVKIMEFEFVAVDCMYFEEKENRYGNVGFYKGLLIQRASWFCL